MGMKRGFLFGLILGILVTGCAGFAYKYYGMDGVIYEQGKLLGPEPKYDRLFSECAPDAQYKKSKCVVMFYPDFKAFKTDYEDCKMRLDACERNGGGLSANNGTAL